MLKGKTALITGASRGIGQAIALSFAEQGAFVGINYHTNYKGAQQTLATIKKKGGDGMLLKGDVCRDAPAIVNSFAKKVGGIAILINNAGIYNRKVFTNLEMDGWKQTLDVNLTGCFQMCKQALPHMTSGGRIIFISSQLAFKGTPHGADYASSKAGVLGLMKSLALELAEKHITVNAVAPGIIETDVISSYTKTMKEKRIQETPLGRLGTPLDVAHACLFFASENASYITGETLHVNGGLYIH